MRSTRQAGTWNASCIVCWSFEADTWQPFSLYQSNELDSLVVELKKHGLTEQEPRFALRMQNVRLWASVR